MYTNTRQCVTYQSQCLGQGHDVKFGNLVPIENVGYEDIFLSQASALVLIGPLTMIIIKFEKQI